MKYAIATKLEIDLKKQNTGAPPSTTTNVASISPPKLIDEMMTQQQKSIDDLDHDHYHSSH